MKKKFIGKKIEIIIILTIMNSTVLKILIKIIILLRILIKIAIIFTILLISNKPIKLLIITLVFLLHARSNPPHVDVLLVVVTPILIVLIK